jgi:hypothetical protein
MSWAFDISPAPDGQSGRVLPDKTRLTQGFVPQPVASAVTITPRSEARGRMVVEEWRAAERERLDSVTRQWLLPALAGGGEGVTLNNMCFSLG